MSLPLIFGATATPGPAGGAGASGVRRPTPVPTDGVRRPVPLLTALRTVDSRDSGPPLAAIRWRLFSAKELSKLDFELDFDTEWLE